MVERNHVFTDRELTQGVKVFVIAYYGGTHRSYGTHLRGFGEDMQIQSEICCRRCHHAG